MQDNYLNFDAKLVAKIKAKVPRKNVNFELYEIDKFDKEFVSKLIKKVDLESLYPNLDSYKGFAEWKNLINHAVDLIGDEKSILAIHNKKPCGIMVYEENINNIDLSYLIKWRIKPNQDLPYIGKILMRYLFEEANKNKVSEISLYTAICRPRGKSCVNFYKFLGFKKQIDDKYKIQEDNFNEKCAQLDSFFDYYRVDNAKNIPAENILDSNTNDNFREYIAKKINYLFKYLGKK